MGKLTRGARQALRVQGGPNAQAGVGSPVNALPQNVYYVQHDFSGGEWQLDDETQIPENGSSIQKGYEISSTKGMTRMKGFIQWADAPAGQKVVKFAVHPNVQNPEYSDLVVFTETHFAVSFAGSPPISWTLLPFTVTSKLSTAIYGDTLLIMDEGAGAELYARATAAPNFTLVPGWGGGARSITTWAGRVWAGGTAINPPGAVFQGRGIKWSGSADYSDLTGLDSGEEILLDDVSENDYIQALVPMNEQTLGIVMRKSVWVGRFTGDAFRPAHFVKIYDGVGAKYKDTVKMTPLGLMFVSDEGVKVFDGSVVRHVSAQIDQYLFSETNETVEFHAFYESGRERYWLLGFGASSFIFDIKSGSWISIKTQPNRHGISMYSAHYNRPIILNADLYSNKIGLQSTGENYFDYVIDPTWVFNAEWVSKKIGGDTLRRGVLVKRIDVMARGLGSLLVVLDDDQAGAGIGVGTIQLVDADFSQLYRLDVHRYMEGGFKVGLIPIDGGDIQKIGVVYQPRGEYQ